MSIFSSAELNNGLKKEVSSKDVARIWVNDDMKMRSFSPVNVSFRFFFLCDEPCTDDFVCKFNVFGFKKIYYFFECRNYQE